MQLWQRLYGMVWLAFFAIVLVPHWLGQWSVVLHVALGVAVLALALANARALAAKPVPERLKRISRTTSNLGIAQAVLGAALGALVHLGSLPHALTTAVAVFHVVVALAILAQAASVATSYDMWEEKEYATAPPPGAPDPAGAGRPDA